MRALKWINIWWFIIIMLIPLVGLFNYVIDPLGFNKKILINHINIIKEDNTRFTIKYKMPRLREGIWTNIMFGTSRIGLMDTGVVDNYLGRKTFTASQPGSAMPIQFDSFFYAIKFNDVKNVIYGIDFMTFNKNIKLNNDYVQFKDELQSFGAFYTYDIYFNTQTLKKSINTILNNISDNPRLYAFYSESGMRNFPQFKQQMNNGHFNIQTSINKHIQKYFKKDGFYAKYEYSPKYMQMFKKIVDYCHENDINLYVYISPVYFEHFYAIKEAGLKDEFEHFKRELVKVTEFIDFTGSNSITTDKTKFWDSSHLKKEYTNLIMQKVLNKENQHTLKDFGVNVNEHNIEEHLQRQSSQYTYINLKEILDIIY